MDDVAILLLAAGGSTRMRGGDKLLERIDGEPLLHRQAQAALAAADRVLVTLPPNAPARRAVLADLAERLTVVEVADAASGMASSIRAGVAQLPPDCTAVLIVPADMPELDKDAFFSIISKFNSEDKPSIVRATSADNQPGHPVLFPRFCFPALLQLQGDRGARDVVQQYRDRVLQVPLPDRAALTDLDTPEDWANWRARTKL